MLFPSTTTFRLVFSLALLLSVTRGSAQDTTFAAEINRNFRDYFPRILALRSNNDPSILTGPSGNGTNVFNTNLLMLPDGYHTINFSDERAVRYETYLPYQRVESRNALYDFIRERIVAHLKIQPYSTESYMRDDERKTTWLLRQPGAERVTGTEIILWETRKLVGTQQYYLLNLNVINKKMPSVLREGKDSIKVRLVQPRELITILAKELPAGLKPLSMFTQNKDTVEFYPFIQMPQFAVQPNAGHLINNYASWYAGQVRYEANRYFPEGRQQAEAFINELMTLINPAFPKPPEISRFADNESFYYKWSDLSLPYHVRVDYMAQSSSFARQVSFRFSSTPEDRANYAIGKDLQAAEKGNAAAMNNVGVAYFNGNLVGKDLNKAAEYFKRSAEAGDKVGMVNYGMVKVQGKGTKQDVKEGLKWYEKALVNNHPLGHYKLALLLREGDQVKKDVDRAISLLKIAADSNYLPAIKELGMIYDDEEGYADKALAARYFRVSGARGDGYSTTMIGYMHEKNGATDSAFFYYDKAVGQRYPMAYSYIGDYRRELNDFAKAWEAYNKGANQNVTYSMNKVAAIYRYGGGTIAVNRDRAKDWYRRSADLGNNTAKDALEAMMKEDRPQVNWEED